MPTPEEMTFDLQIEEFDPTFTGSRQERQWIRGSLEEFWQDHLLTDVLYRVKGGKEATVYCCRAHSATGLTHLAAKVLRPRKFRAMKNYSTYLEGREVLNLEGKIAFDGRSARALKKMTRFGQKLNTSSWCRHEYLALKELHEAGADVPRPIAVSDNSVLMEFIGDVEFPAPILNSVTLEPSEVRPLFDRLIRNVEIMLADFRIHADLSAYNILYWKGDVTLIDFPQVVDAIRHPNAFTIFLRDLTRLCEYFRRQGLDADPVTIAHDLWKEWVQ
jgi:RIO kinase 1